ncbi:MAG: PQQ-dependent sugar dehydrogenase [Robiginitomaculum sp.]|nr:PQQ-dependent sugar dehydrogenase [Robiginitomaculum sp.]
MRKLFSLTLAFLVITACGQPQAKESKEANEADKTSFTVIHSEQSKQASFDVVQITDGLDSPWGLAFLPDGDFLITQKTGDLVRFSNADGKITIIDGAPEALVLGQGGLLDIVLSPNFLDDKTVFISFAEGSKKQNHTAIAKAKLVENKLIDLEIIFRANTTEKSGGGHFGSRLLFDNAGYLYASIGDGFKWLEQAQNPHNNFGTIVRLNSDGSIPNDNPFYDGKEGDPSVWSYGHRNPQGLTLHPKTGEVWQSEHGAKGGDEINIITKGNNYGWPKATFSKGYSGKTISKFTELPGMVSPILVWTPSIAPSGLDFYVGDKFSNWNGDLFSGALRGQHLRRIELDGQTIVEQEELLNDLDLRIRDVRSGPDGFLYLLTDGGQLLRLQPAED